MMVVSLLHGTDTYLERLHQVTGILLISWPMSHPCPAVTLHGLSAMQTWNEAIPGRR